MIVKLLSGGNTRSISHVGSVESFVFSLNKKRKRKHLQDLHGLGSAGPGLLHWLKRTLLLREDRNRVPGKAGGCQEKGPSWFQGFFSPGDIFLRV